MCGIYGSVSTVPGDLDLGHFTSSLTLLSHRGPDDKGVWQSPYRHVTLGHRRLSVIDVSHSSHQPMTSECGNFTIVFNGEIYNFLDVKKELINSGYNFFSSGDTEVVLRAYQHWGERCLDELNGMFAFVIFHKGMNQDEPGSVFFARDRAGEKPFYYCRSKNGFLFSSELKALPHSRDINIQALNFYLSLGYVPGELCLFDGVNKLPPGHCGKFDLKTGVFATRRYWALPSNRPASNASGEELALEAGSLIEDSVRQRLIADVPVGVLLSGGLDSSLVTAAAARVSSRPVETFTIALPGSSIDEAAHAQKVASHFGTRHHVLPLEKPSLSLLDGLAPYIDEPIADSSILPAWLVFGLARNKVTVALGGDGGDELFGGYSDYTTSIADYKRLKAIPPQLLRLASLAAANLPAGVKGRNRLASLRNGPFKQMIWGRPYFDWLLRKRILTSSALELLGSGLDSPELFLESLFETGSDPVDSMTRTHFGSILPDDFLVKVDRASMAHSLEVRAPFLDHRLIEFAFSRIPSNWKVEGTESRRIQKLLAAQWLPSDLNVTRKQGFSIPINEWLRHEGERGLMKRMEALPGQINMDQVVALVRGHLSGRANGGRLFALIMLAIAMRNI